MTQARSFLEHAPEAWKVLLEAGHSVELGEGEVLFRRGETGDALFLVEGGEVEVLFDDGRDGKRLGPGQIVGEIGLLAPGVHRTATIVAATAVRLRRVDGGAIEALKGQRPEDLCSMLQETCAYLVRSEANLVAGLQARAEELEQALDYLRRTREELDAKELLAITDELTGLYNRRGLNRQLPRLLKRAEREAGGLAAVVLDLDEFKPINDTYGHAAGDVVLKRFANVLREEAGTEDFPCRLGGDEFALVVVGCGEPEARARAERLCEVVATTPIRLPEATIAVSASVGGAAWQQGDDGPSLLARADAGLYAAKEAGRRRVGWRGASELGG